MDDTAMSVRRTVTVSITPEQDALLTALLQSGRYRSISEVMRAALRLLERDEATMPVVTRSTTPQRKVGRA